MVSARSCVALKGSRPLKKSLPSHSVTQSTTTMRSARSALRDSAARRFFHKRPAASARSHGGLCAQPSQCTRLRCRDQDRMVPGGFGETLRIAAFARPCAAKDSRLLVKAPALMCAMDAPANHRRRQAPPLRARPRDHSRRSSADANCACQNALFVDDRRPPGR